MDKDKFIIALDSTIQVKISEILATKPEDKKFLNYFDSMQLTKMVKNIFMKKIGIIPPEVEMACNLSQACLAPDIQTKIKLIKACIGIGGGIVAIGMIISALATALGWGTGVVAAVTAFFTGTALLGPIAIGTVGIGIAAIAAYFALSGNEVTDSQRFIKAFSESVKKATEAIWAEYEELLSKED